MLPGIFTSFCGPRKGVTRLLSANANGEPANGRGVGHQRRRHSRGLESASDCVESGDTARSSVGIYMVRLTSGLPTRLDLTSAGRPGAGQSMSPTISADGRFVAFVSKADLTCGEASTCVTEPSDKKGVAAVYLRDTHTNTTRRVTSSYTGGAPNGPSYNPAISGDGRHVAFVSEASN
jgi:Tol biopolymer transport system component